MLNPSMSHSRAHDLVGTLPGFSGRLFLERATLLHYGIFLLGIYREEKPWVRRFARITSRGEEGRSLPRVVVRKSQSCDAL